MLYLKETKDHVFVLIFREPLIYYWDYKVKVINNNLYFVFYNVHV